MICTVNLLERITGYTIAGSGWCSDYSELPEGGYNTRISNENPLHHEDRIRECMNRCIDASARGAIPSLSCRRGSCTTCTRTCGKAAPTFSMSCSRGDSRSPVKSKLLSI